MTTSSAKTLAPRKARYLETDMNVYYGQTKGRFNLISNEEQWQVYLYTPFGNVGQTFEDEQSIRDCLPTEILDLLEERLKSYWIHSSRERDLAKIAEIRAHGQEIDLAWLDKEIENANARVSKLVGWRSSVADSSDEAA